MMRLALIRHGPTDWNAAKRIQGRTDVSLSDAGRLETGTWTAPADFVNARLISSPLSRAVETAEILFGRTPEIEARLIESNWGAWEGKSLAGLREELGPAMAINEAQGLDFRPEGGESPRDVQDRLKPWLHEIGAGESPVVAVTHRGVMRCVISLALNWDMKADPPSKLEHAAAQFFFVDGDGIVTVDRLNQSLLAPAE